MARTGSEKPLDSIELTAVVAAVTDDEPRVLTIQNGKALPTGPFASAHRSLQMGVRAWVEHQTHHPLGYLEQLYTFADRDRADEDGKQSLISISYLGLTREAGVSGEQGPSWHGWYRYFPWEDWRDGPSQMIARVIIPRLRAWTREAPDPAVRRERVHRLEAMFPDEQEWNEELVLQRYELLYEACLVREAARRGPMVEPLPRGEPMAHDHRRILATGIARLRAKIKYRPIVFELLPPTFTLLQLQRAVEALAGRRLHKQNFRRLIQQQGLIEETDEMLSATGGRPAKLFRFRREVVVERAVTGSKLPLSRTA